MRLSYLFVIVVAAFFAVGEASAFEAPAKLSNQNNERSGTRFLRTDKKADLGTTTDDEERVTMNFAGHLRDFKETKGWLRFWLSQGENEATVTAKLGLSSVPKALRKQHENYPALARFKQMKSGHEFKVGSLHLNQKEMESLAFRWAIAGDSEADVKAMLGISSKLKGDKLEAHRNYEALEMFLKSEKNVADGRKAKLAARAGVNPA